MSFINRFIAVVSLALLAGLVACSSVTLGYNQLPTLAGFWVDRYLDLDRSQSRLLKQQLQTWQAWHRREELLQVVALLRQAQGALADGVTPDELATLERGLRASVERSLQHAAPLAAPLLSSLQPAQWQHLQKRFDKNLAEWRERQSGSQGPDERADKFVKQLERWLGGGLSRSTKRQARADAVEWHADIPALAQARIARQAQTVSALQAWARDDHAGGTALLMRNMQPLPAEQAYRDEITASVLKALNGLSPAERQQVRQHWADWLAELQRLHNG
jgi:hypothetical protein